MTLPVFFLFLFTVAYVALLALGALASVIKKNNNIKHHNSLETK